MSTSSSSQHDSKPSHPTLIKTIIESRNYKSYVVSLVSLPSGSFLASIDKATKAPRATYATVQVSPTEHVNLNSDFLYTNHSCRPNLEFDVEKMEVRVARDCDLKAGDKVTYFYPSTEWKMAQPFHCTCGEQECLGRIDGAKNMSKEKLNKYWLNKHIRELLKETKT